MIGFTVREREFISRMTRLVLQQKRRQREGFRPLPAERVEDAIRLPFTPSRELLWRFPMDLIPNEDGSYSLPEGWKAIRVKGPDGIRSVITVLDKREQHCYTIMFDEGSPSGGWIQQGGL